MQKAALVRESMDIDENLLVLIYSDKLLCILDNINIVVYSV